MGSNQRNHIFKPPGLTCDDGNLVSSWGSIHNGHVSVDGFFCVLEPAYCLHHTMDTRLALHTHMPPCRPGGDLHSAQCSFC